MPKPHVRKNKSDSRPVAARSAKAGRKRIREAPWERDFHRQVMDVAGVILLVVGKDQNVRLVNRKGCEVLGYDEGEIVGRNWFDGFLPERLREDVRGAFLRVMTGGLGSLEYYENPVLTKSGEERVILWHNSILRDRSGRIHSALSSGMDITEKLEMEQRVRQAEKLATVGQLTTGLAHEIGTPLNVIAGRAELMLRRLSAGDPSRENLERILSQIERITKIVNRLLGFTRSGPLETRPVQIPALVKDVLGLFDYQIRENRIDVALDLAESLPDIPADPDQIQQVLLNVIVNAIQSMPAGGALSVRIGRTVRRRDREDAVRDRFVRVEISDTGNGIPPDQLSRVFDPFFTTKDAGRGTGLGLTVSLRIVRSHGGWMTVKSEVGVGSRFAVYLPIEQPARTPAGAGGQVS